MKIHLATKYCNAFADCEECRNPSKGLFFRQSALVQMHRLFPAEDNLDFACPLKVEWGFRWSTSPAPKTFNEFVLSKIGTAAANPISIREWLNLQILVSRSDNTELKDLISEYYRKLQTSEKTCWCAAARLDIASRVKACGLKETVDG